MNEIIYKLSATDCQLIAVKNEKYVVAKNYSNTGWVVRKMGGNPWLTKKQVLNGKCLENIKIKRLPVPKIKELLKLYDIPFTSIPFLITKPITGLPIMKRNSEFVRWIKDNKNSEIFYTIAMSDKNWIHELKLGLFRNIEKNYELAVDYFYILSKTNYTDKKMFDFLYRGSYIYRRNLLKILYSNGTSYKLSKYLDNNMYNIMLILGVNDLVFLYSVYFENIGTFNEDFLHAYNAKFHEEDEEGEYEGDYEGDYEGGSDDEEEQYEQYEETDNYLDIIERLVAKLTNSGQEKFFKGMYKHHNKKTLQLIKARPKMKKIMRQYKDYLYNPDIGPIGKQHVEKLRMMQHDTAAFGKKKKVTTKKAVVNLALKAKCKKKGIKLSYMRNGKRVYRKKQTLEKMCA